MFEIALHNPRQHRQFQHADGPLTLVCSNADYSLWTAVDRSNAEQAHAVVEIAPHGDGITLAMNRCEAESLGDPCTRPQGEWLLPVPTRFTIGDTRFEITHSTTARSRAESPLEKLHADNPCATGRASGTLPKYDGPSPETLSKWFAALGTLNRLATSLQEVYAQAAQAAVEAIGLDGAMILRRRDEEWEIAASHLPNPELGIHCELAVLDQLLDTPETMFQGLDRGRECFATGDQDLAADSPVAKQSRPLSFHKTQSEIEPAVVVAPIRNAAGELCGAVYGYRSVRRGNSRRGIRYLEAHLIELLAIAVSEGIARLEHEAESERRRVLLEQIGAGTNEQSSRRMAGAEREVTLLFADLRDFTRLSASLDTNLLCELLGQVMDCITAAVMDHDGLIIDYYGDGLAAMWNAPADQADHPELACRAALRMLGTLPNVAADWAEMLGVELQLGIGVHTGLVQVGNAGSRRRAKYGPRGANVHLTSRLEKATKEFGVPLLVTQATASRLSNRLHTLRVGSAQLPGFDESVEVFSVGSAPHA